jgi:hypothetical protein
VSATTNQLRAVDVADQAGNNSVYLGFIQTSANRRIDRINSASPYANLNTHAANLDQPKALASDDRGNVFVGERNSGTNTSNIQAFSATLTPGTTLSVSSPVLGGMDVYKSGSTYYAYAGFEANGEIRRYDVTTPAAPVLDTTFGTGGLYTIAGATDIRGVEIDATGNIFAASRGDGKLYKVAADLSSVTSVNLTRAMDVALFGGRAYVTSYNGTTSFIRVYDATTLAVIEDYTIAATILDGNAYTRGANEGWGGIDIDSSGRMWLADQHYGSTGGTQDRLIVSSPVPEPTAGAVLAAGAVMMVARRRRQNKQS